MTNHWYAKTTSAQQGLIIDEATGRTVAVAYNAADKDLIAAAPALRVALADLQEWASTMGGFEAPAWDRARALLAEVQL